jgi:O-antigen ligase
LLIAGLCLPWLNPFTSGPSPSVLPWLVTLGCAALVLLLIAANESIKPGAVALAWLVAAALSSAVGLLQYFGASSSLSPWVDAVRAGEAYANLRQRNQFATLTNIGFASTLWLAAQWQQHRPRRVLGAALLSIAILLAAGNAASMSRTGLVQLLLLGGLVWLWGGLRHAGTRRLLAVALLAYAVATLALPALTGLSAGEHGMVGRLSQGDSVCASRLTLWRNVLHLIAQKPWLGWGWGELDYAHFMTLYPGPRFCEMLDNAHNLPLHLAVELGIPAALLICAGVLWLLLRSRPWRDANPTRQLAWSVLALIGLHSLLEYPLWYGPFQLALGLCLWLLWNSPANTRGQANGQPETRRSVRRLFLALSLLLAAAYAAWDYRRISQIYLEPDQRSGYYRENTLEKIRGSWLFSNQVKFAEFTLTPLTRDNAARLNAMAHELLHYSPEAVVVEKLIESAEMLGRDDEAKYFVVRYQAAYPEGYRRRRSAN